MLSISTLELLRDIIAKFKSKERLLIVAAWKIEGGVAINKFT
ncbi:hypothetical protein BN938_1699 [Mucinivorans hirudinis]|uniref:Uncharacterized protein n=1 Tax=Mucinivorans hirudinis TaxID=1433126 RepID=A0A060RDG2_9BACT|nr:hypothetical protein BN938_1699 [Mucinivorans hirudinis]